MLNEWRVKMQYRLIRCCSVIIFLLFILPSQVTSQVSINNGIKFGLNIAKFTGDDAEGSENLTGLVVGGYLRLGIGFLSIQPEILFTRKGVKTNEIEEGTAVEQKIKNDYLEIPVLIRLGFGNSSGLKPSLFAGPAVALLVNSRRLTTFGGGQSSIEVDVNRLFKEFELGYVIGAGVDVKLGLRTFLFEIRYSGGLSSIDDSGNDADKKNSVISIMGGLAF